MAAYAHGEARAGFRGRARRAPTTAASFCDWSAAEEPSGPLETSMVGGSAVCWARRSGQTPASPRASFGSTCRDRHRLRTFARRPAGGANGRGRISCRFDYVSGRLCRREPATFGRRPGGEGAASTRTGARSPTGAPAPGACWSLAPTSPSARSQRLPLWRQRPWSSVAAGWLPHADTGHRRGAVASVRDG